MMNDIDDIFSRFTILLQSTGEQTDDGIDDQFEEIDIRLKKLTKELTDHILGTNIFHLTQLLVQLNNRSDDQSFGLVFDQYTEILQQSDTNCCLRVLKKIINMTRRLKLANKLKINRFIWKRRVFRNMICLMPQYDNGYSYMKESIFSAITSDSCQITDGPIDPITKTCQVDPTVDLNDVIDTMDSLIMDKLNRPYLLDHLENIFDTNIKYTYDDPSFSLIPASTLDFCVMCLNILIRIMKNSDEPNNLSNDRVIRIFWKAVNVVYISCTVIQESLKENIALIEEKMSHYNTYNPLMSIINVHEHMTIEKEYIKGNQMLRRLMSYQQTIDEHYINQIIEKTINTDLSSDQQIVSDQLMRSDKNNIIDRLLTMYSYFSSEKLDSLNVQNVIYQIMVGSTPVHVKYNAVRLLMTNEMIDRYMLIPNSGHVIRNYILNDIDRLNDIPSKHLHLVDMMFELSQIISEDVDVIEFYMLCLPDFLEQYIALTRLCQTGQDTVNNSMIISDISKMITITIILIRNVNLLGKKIGCYLNDLFAYIEAICCIRKYIPNDNNNENLISLFDTVEKYKTLISLLIVTIMPELNRSEPIVCQSAKIFLEELLCPNSEKIKMLKTIDCQSDTVPQELMDCLTFDLVTDPYFIEITPNNLQLIDRKTLLKIGRSKKCPFTRETVAIKSLLSLNDRPDVVEKRKEVDTKREAFYRTL
jgi:hypothetical protein